jgi:hypothetical protein
MLMKQRIPTISLSHRCLSRGHRICCFETCYTGVMILVGNKLVYGSSWVKVNKREGKLYCPVVQVMLITSALSSLLSFALLMPSIFLCATIALHRVRVAR